MKLDIKLEGKDKLLAVLNPNLYSKILNRTINEIGGKIKTQMSRDARKTYNIKAGDLNKYLKVKRSNYSKLEYSINISSGTRNVKHFGARVMKSRGYVTVKIKNNKGRSTLTPAFKSKNSDAILRRVKGTQEIKSVNTLSVPQMFNQEILDRAEKLNDREFSKTFERNFKYYIGKNKW